MQMIDDLTTEKHCLKAQIAQLEGETLTMKAESAKSNGGRKDECAIR
jgi:hypothetical protein